MASALTENGSTRRWRRIRAAYALTLPVACWRCGKLIQQTDEWDLGHVVDRARGGGDDQLAPEHSKCSRAAGVRLARRLKREGRILPPSRDW